MKLEIICVSDAASMELLGYETNCKSVTYIATEMGKWMELGYGNKCHLIVSSVYLWSSPHLISYFILPCHISASIFKHPCNPFMTKASCIDPLLVNGPYQALISLLYTLNLSIVFLWWSLHLGIDFHQSFWILVGIAWFNEHVALQM